MSSEQAKSELKELTEGQPPPQPKDDDQVASKFMSKKQLANIKRMKEGAGPAKFSRMKTTAAKQEEMLGQIAKFDQMEFFNGKGSKGVDQDEVDMMQDIMTEGAKSKKK